MPEFLDVVRNFGDFQADARESLQQFNGSTGASDNPHIESGYGQSVRARRAANEKQNKRRYEQKMMEARRIIIRAFEGSQMDRWLLSEALSTSDFPQLFGDVIDRSVLSNYLETPYTWNLIAREAQVNDFRPVKRFRIDGGTGLLASTDSSGNLIPLTQGAQYPEDYLTDDQYTYQLQKYGKRMPFFWETFVNDDLNALKDTPARFGRGARRSEEYFVTKLFANNSTLYSNTNKNIVNNTNVGDSAGNNPVLSITALQRAMIVLMNQLDSTGQPISIEAMTLVVPPSLKVVASNILNTDYVMMADQGGTQQVNGANLSATVAQQMHAMNWAKNVVRLAVNYYLPVIDTTYGHTGWYLFANPENGRPAIEFGRLRGHIGPELFMKLPNSVAIGEGAMGPGPGSIPGTTNSNPMDGDFDTDAVHYKVREVFGGTTLDPIETCFSNGSGT